MRRTGREKSAFTGTAIIMLLILSACGSAPKRSPTGDGPPRNRVDYSHVQAPEPRTEPRAKYGNQSPYTVNGMTYHVLASSEGYQQRGRASWYGRKFHGRRTSSGETFDMHKISAAHRTLPLPTFVEVTNLNNGKRLVVRVNDRGPFHDDRIIDLSYAAAVKLGFAEQGTAAVEVRALNIYHAGNDVPTDTDPNRRGLGPDALEPTWLQVGAFSEQKGALAVHLRLRREGFDPVTIVTKHVQDRVIHRVRLGPFHSESALKNQAKRLIDVGFDPPVRVSLACRPEEIAC